MKHVKAIRDIFFFNRDVSRVPFDLPRKIGKRIFLGRSKWPVFYQARVAMGRIYCRTSHKRKPSGPEKVSALERYPFMRG